MTASDRTPGLRGLPAVRDGCPFDPPSAYGRLREERPVSRVTLWDGSRPWLLTRHEDARTVLGDLRFSADSSRPGFPFHSPSREALTSTGRSLTRMDDPEHARLRRCLTKEFTLKRIESLRPEIQRIADGCVDTMARHSPPGDLVAEFALPFPSMVICLLLGVPYDDHAFFQELSRVLLDQRSSAEDVRRSRDELTDYLGGLTASKARSPDEAIISGLVAAGELDHEQIVTLARLMVVAGHETSANMIALGTLALLRNPAQLAAVRADSSLVRGAVEELLRYLTVVQYGIPRLALQDVMVGGQLIRAGEGVLVSLSAANRDASVFDRSDELDVRRNARPHLAFSFGVHQCLGHSLARVELQVAWETLNRRLPELRLATRFESLRYFQDAIVYGIAELPVSWGER
ncbi:cytochrome P450 [Streptomyces sp. NPDC050610]|uniref:cytochrome P450 n=1 Tax=Streptomyces sp. NPDC050610 TaxID=3157097 RepID=UPI0034388F6F